MIDIGVNLTSSQFAGEQADLVARARAAGVEALILTGTDLAGSRESAEQAAEWPGYCFSTAGVHPHDAKSVDEQTLPALRALAALPQVVAACRGEAPEALLAHTRATSAAFFQLPLLE